MPSNNISVAIRVVDGSKKKTAPHFVLSATRGSKINRLSVANSSRPVSDNKSAQFLSQPVELWLERPLNWYLEQRLNQPREQRHKRCLEQPHAHPREQPIEQPHQQPLDRRHAESNRLLSHFARSCQTERLLPKAAASLCAPKGLSVGPHFVFHPASALESVRGAARNLFVGHPADFLSTTGGTRNVPELHGPFPGGQE